MWAINNSIFRLMSQFDFHGNCGVMEWPRKNIDNLFMLVNVGLYIYY